MARIIILDDNVATGTILKKALKQENHDTLLVDNWRELVANALKSPVHLVLIHQTHQNNSGWAVFNDFKKINKQTPVMLYVLPDYQRTSTDWIVKAVNETLPAEKMSDETQPLWTWGSDFNKTEMHYIES